MTAATDSSKQIADAMLELATGCISMAETCAEKNGYATCFIRHDKKTELAVSFGTARWPLKYYCSLVVRDLGSNLVGRVSFQIASTRGLLMYVSVWQPIAAEDPFRCVYTSRLVKATGLKPIGELSAPLNQALVDLRTAFKPHAPEILPPR